MATAELSVEGYDPDVFLESVGQGLICAVCHLVMREPWLVVECGHHFCRACLAKVNKAYGMCPLDREKLTQTVPDKSKWREIQALKVRCMNAKEGCNWMGDLKDYEDHTIKEGCFSQCINGCGEKVRAVEMKTHVEKTCPETIVDCPFKMIGDGCDYTAKRSEILNHVERNQLQHLLYAATACSNMRQYIWKEATSGTKPEDRKTTFNWLIEGFAKKKQEETNGIVTCQSSKTFYTGPCNTGYCLMLQAYLNGTGTGIGTHLSLFIKLCPGGNDAMLAWPFCHNVTLQVLYNESNAIAFTYTLNKENYPLKNRERPTASGQQPHSFGFVKCLRHADLAAFSILSNDCVHIRCLVDWSPWH